MDTETGADGMQESADTFRVIVSLGMKADVQAGSLIKVGDQQLTLVTREDAESKIKPANP
ncbi:hypothetical protein D3C73_1237730 [compost metagenome]